MWHSGSGWRYRASRLGGGEPCRPILPSLGLPSPATTRQGLRRPAIRIRSHGGTGRGAAAPCQNSTGRPRLPARDRIHRAVAEDAQRQDPRPKYSIDRNAPTVPSPASMQPVLLERTAERTGMAVDFLMLVWGRSGILICRFSRSRLADVTRRTTIAAAPRSAERWSRGCCDRPL